MLFHIKYVELMTNLITFFQYTQRFFFKNNTKIKWMNDDLIEIFYGVLPWARIPDKNLSIVLTLRIPKITSQQNLILLRYLTIPTEY